MRYALCVMCYALFLSLVLAGCTLPGRSAPGPLDAARRWGEGVHSYRYERSTVATQEGRTTIVHEDGTVVLPDRQHIRLRPAVTVREADSEVIIVGDRAWVRRAIVGSAWQASRPEVVPADPLTILLGTLRAAGPASNAGERRDPANRFCQGWAYAFEPGRVAGWPAGTGAGVITAEATVWLLPDGAICGQTVRVQREGQPDAEYSVFLRDINVPVSIEPPVG